MLNFILTPGMRRTLGEFTSRNTKQIMEVSDNEIGRKITERLLADFNILVDNIQLSDSSDNRMFIRIGIKKRQENRQLTDALRSL